MLTAAKLAGTFAAHAVWSVSDASGLIPMLAYTTEGQQHMERLIVGEDAEEAVRLGQRRMEENEVGADGAALIYDGWITVRGEGMDAVIVEIRAYCSPDSEVLIAVPYTPAEPGPFRVHRPKLMVWRGCEDFDSDEVFQRFFEGVDAHKEGAKVWNDALDESR